MTRKDGDITLLCINREVICVWVGMERLFMGVVVVVGVGKVYVWCRHGTSSSGGSSCGSGGSGSGGAVMLTLW